MSNLKSRINKLSAQIMTKDSFETLFDKHSVETKRYPRSLDKTLLIDCVIALQVNSCRDHKLGEKARNFLSWASDSEHNIIGRAYNLIDDQVSSGYMSIKPEPVDFSRLDKAPGVPPYAFLCTADQLDKCENKPFWAIK